MLDVLLLSRIQFTFTAVIHYLFVPLTIGLAVFIAYMEFKYWRTSNPLYDKMSRFWTKLFLINFAIGLATGITMEFQFGTNWAAYSRYVGDIFGAPLAAEGVFAFFLESTFIGLLVFGRNKISKGMRFFAALMIAVGTNLSAFWIIAANSWQQTPAGYAINNAMNRAELASFREAVFNPSTMVRYSHVVIGALITAAIFVIAISAYFLIKNKNVMLAKKSMQVAIVIGLVFTVLQGFSGHTHGALVGETQPEKLAAYEAHWETQERAPLLLFAIPDTANETNRFEIGIPGLLSYLTFSDFNASVTGLQEFAAEDRPPVTGNFYAFRIMVGLGIFMIAWMIYLSFQLRKGRLWDNHLALKVSLFILPMPFLANIFGWIVAEWGRQPWIVYGLLRTEDAVSHLSVAEVAISLTLFVTIYLFLLYLMIYLMQKEVRKFDMDKDIKTVIEDDKKEGVLG
ncbi:MULTISPECIES: cytochrome ubiquinol oxidase subunit I [Bacillaceae]|uniref:Cytochrome ubiquinol oxidase subunit I n=1 Tax=Evansella alkalicola TaxID=745819 RepID=A0ABS6JWJ7_9BACI|nr:MULTISPECIES: cytochrome ubiquinol oxidase subunit I [Bacillaceae]MBU9722960.1 cytochrome ubiquinol oxidase subunit I [Bacillus alkalicola]